LILGDQDWLAHEALSANHFESQSVLGHLGG
jgi:hypothetical protein